MPTYYARTKYSVLADKTPQQQHLIIKDILDTQKSVQKKRAEKKKKTTAKKKGQNKKRKGSIYPPIYTQGYEIATRKAFPNDYNKNIDLGISHRCKYQRMARDGSWYTIGPKGFEKLRRGYQPIWDDHDIVNEQQKCATERSARRANYSLGEKKKLKRGIARLEKQIKINQLKKGIVSLKQQIARKKRATNLAAYREKKALQSSTRRFLSAAAGGRA